MPAVASTHADEASACAAAAAARAEVRVELLDDMAELRAAHLLFNRIWSFSNEDGPVGALVMRAFAHTGNYVAAAYDREDAIVAASVGFVGLDADGVPHLHSQISGVLPAAQDRAVGFAVKQHQRAWALGRGIDVIEWTFDPLVRRNAFFNLAKLGAEVVDYLESFYGVMADDLNGGDESDRCLARWRLDSQAARRAATGEVLPPFGGLMPAVPVLLSADADGRPRGGEVAGSPEMLVAWVPDDIVAVRHADPALALEWRKALRETVGAAVLDGYRATGMSRTGWYTLHREAG